MVSNLGNVLAIIDFTILDLRTCFMDFWAAKHVSTCIFAGWVFLLPLFFRVALCARFCLMQNMTGLSLMTNMLRLAVNTLRLRTTMEEPSVLIQTWIFPKGQDGIGKWYDTQQYFTTASSQKARKVNEIWKPIKNPLTLQKNQKTGFWLCSLQDSF